MEKINLLIGKYQQYCGKMGEEKSRSILSEFQTFLKNLIKSDRDQQKIKYTHHHVDFLLSCLMEPSQMERIPFTFVIQILNVIFRFAKNLKIHFKDSLVTCLSLYLQKDENLRTSGRVIDNVVWLVGRLMQMARDRSVLVSALASSKLIEVCLECPSLEYGSQKGLSLLLSYMWKCGVIGTEFILKLLPNLHKFSSQDTMEQILTLLRKISLNEVKNSQQMLTFVGNFLVKYFNYKQIKDQQYVKNWELIVAVAHKNKAMGQQLQISKVIRLLLKQNKLEMAEDILNKSYQAIIVAISNDENLESYLRQGINNVFGNLLARRLFIQCHERIKASFFLEILSGSLPSILEEKNKHGAEEDKILKLLICLKRLAQILGLDSFYEFKFKEFEANLISKVRRNDLNGQLLNLWKTVEGQKSNDYAQW